MNELEKLLQYVAGGYKCYPQDANYLETIWFLAGQPKHLPPNILSSINVSDAEHRERLVAQIHYANSLGGDFLYRLAQYIYLIPRNHWIICNEYPDSEYGIATQAKEMEEAIQLENLENFIKKSK